MITTIELKPGENWVEEDLQFRCWVAAGESPRCHIVGDVRDRHDEKLVNPPTSLHLRMLPKDAIALVLAISKALADSNVSLPDGVLVKGS